MKEYRFHSNIILRTPLLPICLDISEQDVIQSLASEEVEEAIYLGSPIICKKFEDWKRKADITKKSHDKLLNSLRKYLIRMRTRCTPFGLFASCAVIEWGKESKIELNKNCQIRRTRLDMQFLCELIQNITNNFYFRQKLKFYPNNSIYKSFDRYRFIEYFVKDNDRHHQISSVRWSHYLEILLTAAKEGIQLDNLATKIVENDISFQEAKQFVDELVGSQLLVSELDPNVTGTPLLERVLGFLSKHHSSSGTSFYPVLINIKNKLETLDVNKFNKVEAYLDLHTEIKKLEISFDESKLIQTDSFRLIPNGILSEKMKGILNKVFSLLLKLSRTNKETNLEQFKDRFFERYEYEEKPLAEVLDIERGIGYLNNSGVNVTTPLIDGISNEELNENFNIRWTPTEALLFQIAQEATLSRKTKIDLSRYEKEIQKLKHNPYELPPSMSVMFDVVSYKDEHPIIHFKGAFGPSAVSLIGRFADRHKPINKIVSEIANHEEAYYKKQQIELAEIVHLPESRTGNVLFRPSFRKYEIPYLAKSLLQKDYQLEISDLMVSIRNDEVIIRSKKLNKRIIPKLGNAHNYRNNSLPIYHFLGDLQFQNLNNGIDFGWGMLKSQFVFLPRISYENIIVSRAEWNFSEKELKKFRDTPSKILKEWKEKYRLVDLMVLVNGDNELLINLNDSDSVNILISESKKVNFITLKEFLFSKEYPLLKDGNGKPYTNEFIAFLLKNNSDEKSSEMVFNKLHDITVSRIFPPGTNWIYFKIYCGYKTTDKVITQYILPFTELIENEDKIEKWFFIRFQDPEPHIRFRLLVKNSAFIGDIICRFNELLKPLSTNRVVHKTQLDTYIRELERYGSDCIDLAESIFYYDSKCIANFLSLLEGEEGEKYRWFFAMLSIDMLLDDFKFNIDQKLLLLESLKKSFAKEFKVKKLIKDQINNKYRAHRKEIRELFTSGSELRDELNPALELLEERSKEVANCVSIYIKRNQEPNFENLLDSYIHMICNRLFINTQRKHELVLYDFMFKFYKSTKMRVLSKKHY